MNTELDKIKTIYEAVNKILDFTREMKSERDLTTHIMAWDAVKMNLVVIYETDLKISSEIKDKYKSVEWNQIKEYKPILESQYLGFDSAEIWKVIQHKLPEFKNQLEEIL